MAFNDEHKPTFKRFAKRFYQLDTRSVWALTYLADDGLFSPDDPVDEIKRIAKEAVECEVIRRFRNIGRGTVYRLGRWCGADLDGHGQTILYNVERWEKFLENERLNKVPDYFPASARPFYRANRQRLADMDRHALEMLAMDLMQARDCDGLDGRQRDEARYRYFNELLSQP